MRPLIEYAEVVALGNQPFEGGHEDGLQFLDAAQAVMEGDDGTVAGIALHVGQHFGCREVLAVVTRHQVPHDDAVALLADDAVLQRTHPAVGRTEERG